MVEKKDMQKRFCMNTCLMDDFPAMIWIMDVNKKCIHVNKGWLEFVGDTLESQINGGWSKNIYEFDKDYCISTYDAAFNKHMPFKIQYRMKYHDGTYHWILDSGNPLYQDGIFRGYVGTCLDINDKIEDRKLLVESEQLYRKLFDSVTDSIIIIDLETHRIIDANPSAVERFLYSRYELLTLTVDNLSAEPENTKNHLKYRHTYCPLRYYKKKNGIIFPVEVTTSYFKANEKEFAVNIMRDTIDRTQ